MMFYNFNFKEMIYVLSSMISGLSLGGCATIVPSFDVPHVNVPTIGIVPTAQSIVTRIQCELTDIAGDKGTDLDRLIIARKDIYAVVEISLSVTHDGKLAPTFSTMSGIFSFSGGFSYEQSREQNFTEYLTFSLADLIHSRTGPRCQDPPDTNLAGTLGIKQIFQLANSSGPFAKWDKDGDTGVFGGSISFTVDKQITPTGPTWTLTRFTAPGPFLTAYDRNVDKLTFGFVKGPNADKAQARKIALDVISGVKQNQIAGSLQIIANGNNFRF